MTDSLANLNTYGRDCLSQIFLQLETLDDRFSANSVCRLWRAVCLPLLENITNTIIQRLKRLHYSEIALESSLEDKLCYINDFSAEYRIKLETIPQKNYLQLSIDQRLDYIVCYSSALFTLRNISKYESWNSLIQKQKDLVQLPTTSLELYRPYLHLIPHLYFADFKEQAIELLRQLPCFTQNRQEVEKFGSPLLYITAYIVKRLTVLDRQDEISPLLVICLQKPTPYQAEVIPYLERLLDHFSSAQDILKKVQAEIEEGG